MGWGQVVRAYGCPPCWRCYISR